MTRPARLPPELLATVLLDAPHPGHTRPDLLPQTVDPINWPRLFGRDAPVEIEVGFGKGAFLVESALSRPHVNFLGIEVERKYVIQTAGRIVRRKIESVKLVCTEARWFLSKYVAAGSVAALHVYFPDPWWKNRHKKRKLLTAEFVAEARRILAADGVFHFATDVKEYFDETLTLMPGLFTPRSPEGDAIVMTNFERKYRAEGRPIYRTMLLPSSARE